MFSSGEIEAAVDEHSEGEGEVDFAQFTEMVAALKDIKVRRTEVDAKPRDFRPDDQFPFTKVFATSKIFEPIKEEVAVEKKARMIFDRYDDDGAGRRPEIVYPRRASSGGRRLSQP